MRSFICVILIFTSPAMGQSLIDPPHTEVQRSFGHDLCGITPQDMDSLNKRVAASIRQLREQGKIPFPDPALLIRESDGPDLQNTQDLFTPIRFSWPMRATNPGEFTYYHIGNFTDLDSTDGILDYMGGARTYDGHQGIDIGIGPLSWTRMAAADVHAVAAASGVLVEKLDGNFDRNCSWSGWTGSTGRGNHAVVLHADGRTVSYYMHLKSGSVTAKPVGSPIAAGEYLGAIASSGRSTGPHLHFQINVGWKDPDEEKGRFVEPFAGPSNYTTGQSLWHDQKPYYEKGYYMLETGYRNTTRAWIPSSSCDTASRIPANGFHLSNSFMPSDEIELIVYYLTQPEMVNLNLRLFGPGQNTLLNMSATRNPNSFLHFVDKYVLPANAETGVYTYRYSVNTDVKQKYFWVGSCPISNLLMYDIQHSGVQLYMRGGNARIVSAGFIPGSSSNTVLYAASGGVDLTPGFTATAGSSFTANTEGCK